MSKIKRAIKISSNFIIEHREIYGIYIFYSAGVLYVILCHELIPTWERLFKYKTI